MIALQILVYGLVTGANYALVAVGYTLVYGILKFINFTHGDVAMVGSFLALTAIGAMGLGLPAAVGVAVVGCAILGMAIERVAYRPLRRAGRLTPLLTAIGVSLLLENLVQLVFGAAIRTFSPPPYLAGTVVVAGAYVTGVQIAIFAATAVAVAVLAWLIGRTALGRQIRATADNFDLAVAMGVPTDRAILAVFALGSALAGLAGVLFGMETTVTPTMGISLGISAFAAVVLGGIGSVPGAVVGALVLGVAENVGAWFLGGSWSDGIGVLVLALTLLVRPEGLLGRRDPGAVKL
ncbi:MAG: branched-chain amino acid ABC transporter permease [Firmicutes bacterium]|nr:branched-chain amino acid ABC transporter permease [Bacillota bacterium]